jgi:hypothetical protein
MGRSTQIYRAAPVLGYNPENLTGQDRANIINSLQDPRQNIFIAAGYLSSLRDKFLPGKTKFTSRELKGLAGAFNRGEDTLNKNGTRTPIKSLNSYFDPENTKYDYGGKAYANPAFQGLNGCECLHQFD